jgi:polyisoprenyl-phosphate glycosyltransferase
MKKFIILIPVYNDWESFLKLIEKINQSIKNEKNIQFDIVAINDCSNSAAPEIKIPTNIKSIKIINMKTNKGHARCNAFGIRYLAKKENFDYLILMDGDGEDRPEEINLLISKVSEYRNNSVVAKRVKRSEGPFFRFLYQAHKIITYIFTGKKINFGNYSCLTKEDVKTLSDKASLWSSFSGTLKKYINPLNEINSIRGLRYFGPSKMSLFKLGIHSFAIIAVFKNTVLIRSSIILVLASIIGNYKDLLIILIFQILLVVFNLLIFIVSLRENQKDFLNSHLNEESATVIKH